VHKGKRKKQGRYGERGGEAKLLQECDLYNDECPSNPTKHVSSKDGQRHRFSL